MVAVAKALYLEGLPGTTEVMPSYKPLPDKSSQ
jgi:hypothetical protein